MHLITICFVQTLSNEHLDKMAKQYSHMFDLCAPMIGVTSDHPRHLFMEGDVKFKDRDGKVIILSIHR